VGWSVYDVSKFVVCRSLSPSRRPRNSLISRPCYGRGDRCRNALAVTPPIASPVACMGWGGIGHIARVNGAPDALLSLSPDTIRVAGELRAWWGGGGGGGVGAGLLK